MSESEKEQALDILFGDVENGAKTEFLKLKNQTEYEMLPDVMKDTILDTSKPMEKVEIDEVTKTSSEILEEAVVDDNENISSHNSDRALGEAPITNNSNRVEEETAIANNNAESIHEHEPIEGAISTNNFVEESGL